MKILKESRLGDFIEREAKAAGYTDYEAAMMADKADRGEDVKDLIAEIQEKKARKEAEEKKKKSDQEKNKVNKAISDADTEDSNELDISNPKEFLKKSFKNLLQNYNSIQRSKAVGKKWAPEVEKVLDIKTGKGRVLRDFFNDKVNGADDTFVHWFMALNPQEAARDDNAFIQVIKNMPGQWFSSNNLDGEKYNNLYNTYVRLKDDENINNLPYLKNLSPIIKNDGLFEQGKNNFVWIVKNFLRDDIKDEYKKQIFFKDSGEWRSKHVIESILKKLNLEDADND